MVYFSEDSKYSSANTEIGTSQSKHTNGNPNPCLLTGLYAPNIDISFLGLPCIFFSIANNSTLIYKEAGFTAPERWVNCAPEDAKPNSAEELTGCVMGSNWPHQQNELLCISCRDTLQNPGEKTRKGDKQL